MGRDNELLKFLKSQIEVENYIVKSLNEALDEIENPAVKGTLKGISLDSIKHAEMYASAIALLTGKPKALAERHLDKQKSLVERHIELELELIDKISQEIIKVKDDKVVLLLDAILADEKRHHELLKRVLEIIVKGETITDEEWFGILWKSVPFHGAPGG